MLHRFPSAAVRRVLIAAGVSSLFLLIAPALLAQGNRSIAERNLEMRRVDEMRELERKSIEENLPSKTVETPAARLAYKQITEDFRQMQIVNNGMMRASFSADAKRALDYELISKTTAEINRRASRLRSNLQFPNQQRDDEGEAQREIANEAQMRSSLLALDKLIMGFVNNPTFKKAGVLDAQQSAEARRNLSAIIKLSQKIKQTSEKLKN